MFKKNRNALLEEMRTIARSEAKYAATRAVNVKTSEAREAARRKRDREVEAIRLQKQVDEAVARAVEATGHSDKSGVIAPQMLTAPEVILDFFQDILDVIKPVTDFPCHRSGVVGLNDCSVERLDCVAKGCECLMNFAQNTSPVVAESEAVTSDAPAMTVQENTGAGAVSPSAPAQPRFVRLGASVYDRRHDRFLVAVNEAGAESIVDELNEHQTRVVDFNWEDAK